MESLTSLIIFPDIHFSYHCQFLAPVFYILKITRNQNAEPEFSQIMNVTSEIYSQK